MKKFICCCLAIILLLGMFWGYHMYNRGKPLQLVNEVTDKYNNILQQTFCNKITGELITKEYLYKFYDNKWVCVDQRTTIIGQHTKPGACVSNSLKIFHNYEIINGGITILDNQIATVSVIGYYEKESWYEFAYELRITNKTDKLLTAIIDDASIMNISCKPLFSVEHIEAGKTSFFRIGWDYDSLTRSHIPYIDNLEFMLMLFDNSDWKSPALCGERILIKQ
jgi:hypothetical protein